jgi:hypothetical protein
MEELTLVQMYLLDVFKFSGAIIAMGALVNTFCAIGAFVSNAKDKSGILTKVAIALWIISLLFPKKEVLEKLVSMM